MLMRQRDWPMLLQRHQLKKRDCSHCKETGLQSKMPLYQDFCFMSA